MKNKKIIIGIVTILMCTSFTAVPAIGLEANIKNLSNTINEYIPRGEIWIEGNDDFTEDNGVTGGSGTFNDPYIIEGWETPTIWIRDTTAYFTIRNCRVYGESGLWLVNVQNATVQYTFFDDDIQLIMSRNFYLN